MFGSRLAERKHVSAQRAIGAKHFEDGRRIVHLLEPFVLERDDREQGRD